MISMLQFILAIDYIILCWRI